MRLNARRPRPICREEDITNPIWLAAVMTLKVYSGGSKAYLHQPTVIRSRETLTAYSNARADQG